MAEQNRKLLSQIPQIDQTIHAPELKTYVEQYSRDLVRFIVQKETERLRQTLLTKGERSTGSDNLSDLIVQNSCQALDHFTTQSLRKTINATGVILHTGLGRAPLSLAAAEAVQSATGYCNLEIDLTTGKRGNRVEHVEALLCFLTGAESACVVNNNAAAVFLALNTLAFGKEAIISRGQLVEIGGSFRIPEVMEKSGAVMREIGTTNKTHLPDFESAISKNTGVICVVHTSNYRVQGFVADVALEELAALAKKHKIPLLQDLGGGVLFDLREFGLPYEPVVRESIESGVDAVTFSGDKVLGGPQCGIIVGKSEVIQPIKSNPLMRALRCDKLILAALEATLRGFLQPGKIGQQNPVMKMLKESEENLAKRARSLKAALKDFPQEVSLQIEQTTAQIGSGAMPLETLPSRALVLSHEKVPPSALARRFRLGDPPVVGYVRHDKLYFDLRTVFEGEDEALRDGIQKVLQKNR